MVPVQFQLMTGENSRCTLTSQEKSNGDLPRLSHQDSANGYLISFCCCTLLSLVELASISYLTTSPISSFPMVIKDGVIGRHRRLHLLPRNLHHTNIPNTRGSGVRNRSSAWLEKARPACRNHSLCHLSSSPVAPNRASPPLCPVPHDLGPALGFEGIPRPSLHKLPMSLPTVDIQLP